MSAINGTFSYPSYRADVLTERLTLTAVLATFLLLKAWLLWFADIQLYYDEAQYWEWAQRLDWGYYSKGPLTAWLIALSEYCFGKGEWQVRLFSWLAHGGFLYLLFQFTRTMFHSSYAAWWAVVIAATAPVYFILGSVMTTDSLLLFFWTWAMWAIYRALVKKQNSAWYEAGIAIGLGAMAKLTIGLLPLAVAIVMLLHKNLRWHLRNPHLWLGVLLILVCMSPMLIWNYHNDWVLLRHESRRFVETSYSFISLGVFALGQLIILSPIIAISALVSLYHRPKHPGRFLVWGVSIVLLAFFLAKSLTTELEVDWPAPIYIGWIVLFARVIDRHRDRFKTWMTVGVGYSAILIYPIFFPHTIGLSHRDIVLVRNVTGWSESIKTLYTYTAGTDFLLTDSYPLAAELAFYWPEPVPVYVTGSAGRRFNQHDLWPGVEQEAGNNGLYVSLKKQVPAQLGEAFTGCQQLPSVTAVAKGKKVRAMHAQLCENYNDFQWPVPSRY